MQDHGDRPARAGRPSLLSSAAQAEADHQRILSSLDGGAAQPAGAPARAARPRARGWVWGGAAVAGIAAVALLLFAAHDGEEDDPVVARHVAAPVVASAAPDAAAAPAAVKTATPAAEEAAPAPEPEENIEHGAPANIEPAPANPLADMAPTPAHAPASAAPARPARAGAHADPLTRALESRPASRPRHEVKKAAPAQAKPAHKPARTRAQNEPDSDVVLLAALMSHIDPRARKATLADRLHACKRYNAAGEEQCRARVCAAERKDPACKGVPGIRTEPDS